MSIRTPFIKARKGYLSHEKRQGINNKDVNFKCLNKINFTT